MHLQVRMAKLPICLLKGVNWVIDCSCSGWAPGVGKNTFTAGLNQRISLLGLKYENALLLSRHFSNPGNKPHWRKPHLVQVL